MCAGQRTWPVLYRLLTGSTCVSHSYVNRLFYAELEFDMFCHALLNLVYHTFWLSHKCKWSIHLCIQVLYVPWIFLGLGGGILQHIQKSLSCAKKHQKGCWFQQGCNCADILAD
jgi:hypothetical protein